MSISYEQIRKIEIELIKVEILMVPNKKNKMSNSIKVSYQKNIIFTKSTNNAKYND
ncbi:protein of unknown function [Candidatus Nitrosocosmicus franklandus]|uniref:Uncharacterized protein n=1 Tax=Candidatus Nitrosocosmicus franklandianus TaxID=1798806 RepID=A0A484I926_9ARCH|nr:protein of unknown function [Candidatus Nitrosocosmicus franklandus]